MNTDPTVMFEAFASCAAELHASSRKLRAEARGLVAEARGALKRFQELRDDRLRLLDDCPLPVGNRPSRSRAVG